MDQSDSGMHQTYVNLDTCDYEELREHFGRGRVAEAIRQAVRELNARKRQEAEEREEALRLYRRRRKG